MRFGLVLAKLLPAKLAVAVNQGEPSVMFGPAVLLEKFSVKVVAPLDETVRPTIVAKNRFCVLRLDLVGWI